MLLILFVMVHSHRDLLDQGGMHYVGYAEMAAAVSNAGGLGMITALTVAMGPDPLEALRAEIRKCKTLTKKPFGYVICEIFRIPFYPFEWHHRIHLTKTPIRVNITLLPVGTPPDFPGIVKVLLEEGVKIIETAGRDPSPVLIPLKAAGCVILHKCVAIRHALKAARIGADIISMDGFDCGGHPGEEDVGNWVLLAKAGQVLKAAGIPFIASGGCATGSQLAAALAMGAEGINMGTAFMATNECPIHDNIKKAIIDASETDTTHIFRTVNNTERVFKNDQARKVRAIEAEHPGDFSKLYEHVRGELYRQSFQETGDVNSSVWSCGQSIGLIDEALSCQQLVSKVVTEAAAIIQQHLPAKIQSSKL